MKRTEMESYLYKTVSRKILDNGNKIAEVRK